MPLPHFLCIGAQKAGTSWLHAQLSSHPGIWIPPLKEVQYFSHVHVPEHRKWTPWHLRSVVNRAIVHHVSTYPHGPNLDYLRYLADVGTREPFTDAWYRLVFDRPAANGKVVGDVTPEYSTIPEAGLAHVRALLGAVKIIYLIRRPLPRALSQLRMNALRRGVDAPSAAEWEEMLAQWQWDIANRGDYKAYIPRWKAHFARDDLLFVPYGRLAQDPEGVMRDVEAFLGLARHGYPRAAERVHETGRLDVPDWVSERIAGWLDGQDDFLEGEFGSEFCALL